MSFVYLVAIIDWYSRAVLAWRLSTTVETDFCLRALDEALARWGRPEIFNTDQGVQFTSEQFTGALKIHGIQISMDGKGRCLDNVFVERLWRSLKTRRCSSARTRGRGRRKMVSAATSSSSTRSARTKRWATGRRWKCIESRSAARERLLDGICCTR
jgi:transposase InsO family protein